MLGVLSKSVPDSVDKSLRLTQALAKEGLKFFEGNGDVNLIFHLPLVLLLAKLGGIFEKNGGK